MPILYVKLIAAGLVGVLLAGGGYRVGIGLERGKWLEREREIQAIAAEHQRARNAAALAVSTARQQAVSAQRERVREVIRRVEVPVRAECDWNEPERVRLQSAYDALFPNAASGVPGNVPAATEAGSASAAMGD